MDLGHLTYWGVLAITFLGPFFLGFHSSIYFNKKWRSLVKAIALILTIYLPWDMFFTQQNIWSFHSKYLSGFFLFNIPIEEALFFIATPFSCLFVFECVRYYLPKLTEGLIAPQLKTWSIIITAAIIFFGISLIMMNPKGWYTLSAVITAFLGLIYLYQSAKKDYLQIIVAWLILLIPFFICNGILTGIAFWEYPIFNHSDIEIKDAVVLYNNQHNSGFRIWSVPSEDFFYGFGFYALGLSVYLKSEK